MALMKYMNYIMGLLLAERGGGPSITPLQAFFRQERMSTDHSLLLHMMRF